MLEARIVASLSGQAKDGAAAGLLAHHWLRAEEWNKALDYTLEAAKRARKLFARPEAINHYWQALELFERLPQTPERSDVHCDIIMSLIRLPGWMRNEEAEGRLFRHVDQALAGAIEAGDTADMAKLETIKGYMKMTQPSSRARSNSPRFGRRVAEAWVANLRWLSRGMRNSRRHWLIRREQSKSWESG